MYSFDYQRAADAQGAVKTLAGDADAKYLAGGQSLLAAMKLRLAQPSTLVDITRIPGLKALVEEIRARGIRSIAIPPLGSGLGGLNWADVRPRIVEALRGGIEHARAQDQQVRVAAGGDDRVDRGLCGSDQGGRGTVRRGGAEGDRKGRGQRGAYGQGRHGMSPEELAGRESRSSMRLAAAVGKPLCG